MLRIDVSAGTSRYPIYIEHGLTAQLGRLVEQAKPGARQIFRLARFDGRERHLARFSRLVGVMASTFSVGLGLRVCSG